jgi:hypothetical protein
MRIRRRLQHDPMRWFRAAPRDLAALRLGVSLCTALHAVACSHAPPADFAPDPGLVEQIRDIRIIPGDGRACPGAKVPANYEAVLADGSRVPFARSYDKKHPPRLHVVLLNRESPDAVSRAGRTSTGSSIARSSIPYHQWSRAGTMRSRWGATYTRRLRVA